MLAVDIGGTNTRIAIFDEDITFYEKFPSSMERVYALLHGRRFGSRSVVAFPSLVSGKGPFKDKGIVFDPHEFASRLSLSRVDVINDVEAGAYRVMETLDDTIALSSLPSLEGGVLVVYAGTGLGVALIRDGIVYPSEINRFIWAPETFEDHAFATWFEGPHTFDRICSGPAISAYYAFRSGFDRDAIDIADRPFDSHAREALDFFFDQLARFCASCAHALLPFGGIVLCGSIVSSNTDRLSGFVRRFRDRCFHAQLRDIPIAIDIEHDINLKGCYEYSQRFP